jgi:hypothetical protein
MEVVAEGVVLPGVDSEEVAEEAGNNGGELKNLLRTFYNSPDGKSGLPLHPRPQIEKLLSSH